MLTERTPLDTLVPGVVSAPRTVPPVIERPKYMFHPGPETVTASDAKDAETIERIRTTGRIAVDALYEAGEAAVSGVTTDGLDRVAYEYMCDHGACPSCLGHTGFPKPTCTSANEVIRHGIPDSAMFKDSGTVNLGMTARIGGVHGDTNAMFAAGEIGEESRLLVECMGAATLRGARVAKLDREIDVIGRVTESYIKRSDYGAIGNYTGHDIGEAFHSGFTTPHHDTVPSHATVTKIGMVFAVELMFTLGNIA